MFDAAFFNTIAKRSGAKDWVIIGVDPENLQTTGLSLSTLELMRDVPSYLGSSKEGNKMTFWVSNTERGIKQIYLDNQQIPKHINNTIESMHNDRSAPLKIRHDLHLCANQEIYIQNLTLRGFNVIDYVASLIPDGTEFACLATGSIVEGLGSDSSDMDFLVISPEKIEIDRSKQDLVLAQGAIRDLVFYDRGIEYNIEFISQSELSELMEELIALGDTMYDSDKLPTLPDLAHWKKHFLHRLRCGWVVTGDAYVERLRDDYMVDVLPIYETVASFFESIEMLEDLSANTNSSAENQIYMARTTMWWVLISICANAGYTSTSKKWLIHWLEKLKHEGSEIAAEGIDIYINLSAQNDRSNEEITKTVSEFIDRVQIELSNDAVAKDVIGMIRKHLSYTNLR